MQDSEICIAEFGDLQLGMRLPTGSDPVNSVCAGCKTTSA